MTTTHSYYQTYSLQALRRYWLSGSDSIEQLPVLHIEHLREEPLPPRLLRVSLPSWASDLSEEAGIPIPSYLIQDCPNASWKEVGWWQVIHWYLNCTAERVFEDVNGPIHSYSFRLEQWAPVLWERAWVNRIALFLRRWVAQILHKEEEIIFGKVPTAEIMLTHDVDAISKTLPIRVKQSAFHVYNGFRSLIAGNSMQAVEKFRKALNFMFSNEDYWAFDVIEQLENKYSIKSTFNLYGATNNCYSSPIKLLFDPSYDVNYPKVVARFKRFVQQGYQIGLHQSFASWSHPSNMKVERANIEKAIGCSVISCRQHWLRFSWNSTWQSQAAAGLKLDTTLGFNDRPGFRNGAAIRLKPFQDSDFESLPLVLMDSHLYDYQSYTDEERFKMINRIIDEIVFVGGQATVVWHTHVLGADYGWKNGFEELLVALKSKHS